MLLGYSKNK